jgi:glycosyltransferase involved in cell wall biosynthesis
LDHRFSLFEKYCLPSIANQTCKGFEWIVLFDSTTPESYKGRIAEYQQKCPHLTPVYVNPNGGRYFAQIFRDEVVKRVQGSRSSIVQGQSRIGELENTSSFPRVLTTYLDNDDALDIRFVEDIQKRVETLPDGTFINYTNGFQFFTDYNYAMCIHFPRNHFMSFVENGNPPAVKTIYGYGSHYYINKIEGVRIEKVKDMPMWCEVIHEKNMGNDAYFLFGAKMIGDKGLLKQRFAIDEDVYSGFTLYAFRFLPRYFKTFIRRIGYFFFGRHW